MTGFSKMRMLRLATLNVLSWSAAGISGRLNERLLTAFRRSVMAAPLSTSNRH
jgi:hypothetical protein